MAKNKNYKAFTDAVRAHGGVKYYDLGGGVNLAQGATQVGGAVGGPTTNGGFGSLFTPQSAFNAQLAPTTQLNYTPVVNQAANQALQGQQQFNQNLTGEQALAQQFINQGNGQGPNPAQAQLAQNTAGNMAQQAALNASARGASGNVGLMARQNGMQGAATQQNAVGQAATLQAQQELASQQAAAAQQQAIGSQITNQQGANTQLFGTGAGAANTQNANLVNNYNQANSTNAQTAQANAKATQGATGGGLGILGTALPILGSLFANGGKVTQPASTWENPSSTPISQSINGPASTVGKFLSNMNNPDSLANGVNQLGTGLIQGIANAFAPRQVTDQNVTPVAEGGTQEDNSPFMAAKGGKVPAMVSPGEIYLPPDKAKKVAEGKESPNSGKRIPGQAKVKGNSLKNDTVPAVLESGGIVIPRSHANSPGKAAAFVRTIMAKKRGK